jgi:basic membrane lipoprotein Med (substrate-binding protein (PBP1-ABC) superfamily)
MKRHTRTRGKVLLIALIGVVAVIAAACGQESETPPAAEPRLIVGAIHVGSIDDAGYNQAQHEGLMEMKQAVPGVKVIEAQPLVSELRPAVPVPIEGAYDC